jgi:hypothetical protein
MLAKPLAWQLWQGGERQNHAALKWCQKKGVPWAKQAPRSQTQAAESERQQKQPCRPSNKPGPGSHRFDEPANRTKALNAGGQAQGTIKKLRPNSSNQTESLKFC